MVFNRLRQTDTPWHWRVLLFALWLGLIAVMAAHHVMWRDEVRALTLALSGESMAGMARAVHGDGHPLLWYVLLRVAHDAGLGTAALPATGLAIGVAGAALLAWRAPFGPGLMALILAGRMMLFEYSVMARNYGISMLLLFVLAAIYPRHRRNGLVLGALLFLLANTNVHSVILVVAFLLFWLTDLLLEDGPRPGAALRTWAWNAALAGLGILACVLTVYPPFNDAAGGQPHIAPWTLAQTALLNGVVSHRFNIVLQLALVLALAGALRWPPVALALLAAAFGFSLFFNTIYPGDYRHRALLVAFAISMVWIAIARGPQPWPIAPGWSAAMRQRFERLRALADRRWLQRAAKAGCAIILFFDVAQGAESVIPGLTGTRPRSQAAAFARVVRSRTDLAHATILADPDYLLEPLPYYLDNDLYLQREHRMGRYAIFTRSAQQVLSLGEMLDNAHRIAAMRHGPVILLVSAPLDPAAPPRAWHEGYSWTFQTDATQIARLHRETVLLGHFAPAETDEAFDAYILPATRP